MMLLFAHSILEVELAVTWYRLICGILSLLVLHRIVWHSWSSRLLWNYIVFSVFSDFLDFLKFYYLIILSPLFVCGFTLILACHLLLFLILWGRSLFLIPYKGVRLGISHIPWDGSLRDSCRLIHVRCSRDEVHWNVLYASSLIDQVLKMKSLESVHISVLLRLSLSKHALPSSSWWPNFCSHLFARGNHSNALQW